ncbi:[FeFe] hydrogenase, group A [Adlercreutzia sp. ZJ138]|uniref:[FeFe] hydrogenase, group A n=1 Tax=Adlercreutzia sp. ZJ138 TaxID=2709405 RepID=UPI0013EBB661|nr:[FeFe] hydrogenase, group A [Adlercreutzia sp. ZJ138]
MCKVTINGREVEVSEGTTILEAAGQAGVYIPTLCYLKDVNEIASCRICVVEVEGQDELVAACNTPVVDGMVVRANTSRVRTARKENLALILSTHNVECTTCIRSGNCKLQTLSNDFNMGAFASPSFEGVPAAQDWPQDFPLIRDASKCIRCMRCVNICERVQASGVWKATPAGGVDVAAASIEESPCTLCGQCITHCPVGALTARDDTARVFAAINDPDTITVVQVAPAVRAAWAESWGIPREEATPGRMAAALRRIGFDYVFDTDWSADLTIMEEGSEFVARVKNAENETFPMFTSCCPGWVRYIKAQWPQYVDQLSTAKSPQQMFGAAAKTWFAEKEGIDPNKIFCMSVMPCVAKKHECALENMNDAGAGQDVDLSVTTREMARMLRECGIDPRELEEEEFDNPLGNATGAGVIFGATGGVMEAALRSAYFLVTGENPDPDAFRDVRGLDGWKEATFDLAGIPLRVAVASGLANTNRLLAALDAGEVQYDFVEIMACPGGCAGGGGQPIHDGQELAGVRGDILYGLDKHADLRFSHENPTVLQAYEEYFGAPCGERPHHLLHSDHHDWSMPHK